MRLTLMLAGAALLASAPASAEDWDFILVNESGKEIKAIEVSPSGANSWAPNKIDEGVAFKPVTAGGRTTVHFDKTGCRYDLKATFADDTSAVWTGINVCDNAYVTVRYRNGAPTFAAS